MTHRRTIRTRAIGLGAAALGAAMLVGAGAGAAASAEEYGESSVDIGVEIAEPTQPGVLAMTVAAASTQLTEEDSTAAVRRFSGRLPTVTVTDTRTAEEIPDGAGWYVLGSASGFTGDDGQPAIGAENLGWTPRLVDGGDSGGVAEGEKVDTALEGGDDAVGLVDQELLALAIDSEAIAAEGSWTADADLLLTTPATVAPGGYSAVLTLSLFE